MPLTQPGRDLIARGIIGSAATSEDWNSTNALIVVGNSSETFSSTQNDVGSTGTSRAYASQDGGFPTYSVTSGGAPLLSFRSTFATGAANFAWKEWLVRNSSSTGASGFANAALNRKVEDLGTKTSAQSWQITAGVVVTT